MRTARAVTAVLGACSVAIPTIITPVLSAGAWALDMPARKPGLWTVTMTIQGHNTPPMKSEHCVDAETDKLMNNFAGGTGKDCTKVDLQKTATGYVFDSTCRIAGAASHSHGTITGSMDSAYTIDVTSERDGGAARPGLPAQTHMTIAAQWAGACKAGQKPGDMVMPNGMTLNIKDVLAIRNGMHSPPPRR